MLEITTKLRTQEILDCPNLLYYLDEQEARCLGSHVTQTFTEDKNSRNAWEHRMRKAMEMALQILNKKTFPWENAANAKLPLITVAAIQYHSRAYPALMNGPHPVKARVALPGDKQEEQRALRISQHMCYQVLEEMLDWEEEHDKAILIQAIMGCVFKKTYFDPSRSINRSICVSPDDLYLNYWSTSVEEAPRATHLMYLSHNTIYEYQCLDLFSDFTTGDFRGAPTLREPQGQDKRQGTTPPPNDRDTPYECLEQCIQLDLDGDGYREPYVATVRYDTRQALRLAPLYTRKDIVWTRPVAKSKTEPRLLRINPCSMYTQYVLIPSPDRGIYGLGLGSLLGPLSEIVDSAINQMLDAGTMATAGGGFLGKNAKLKKGNINISPGKWVQLDCPGNQMKDAVMPLPVPQPSEALFKLIGLLIEWGQNIVGATDAMLGQNPGQNTPAQTQQSMLEQGMAAFNGIYKRTYKAQTKEFQKLYRLNVNFLADGETKFYTSKGDSAKIFQADYSSDGVNLIRPGANPRYMSDQQRLTQAVNIYQAAQQPGWDRYEAGMNLLEAWKVEDPDRYLINPRLIEQAQQSGDMSQVPPGARPQPNPVIITAQAKQAMAQAKGQEVQWKIKEGQAELQMAAAKLKYEIAELSAKAAMEMAQAQGVSTGHQIALLEAQIGAKNAHLDHVLKLIEMTHNIIGTQMESEDADKQRAHEASMAVMEAARGDQASPS